jgi:hypothetical protein
MLEDFDAEDIIATGMFIRVYGELAPSGRYDALLSTDLRTLVKALAEVRAREWQRAYQQCRRDHLNGMDVPRNLDPDLPTQDELGQIRGERRDPTSPSGWTSVDRPDDYPGGRWPGKENR